MPTPYNPTGISSSNPYYSSAPTIGSGAYGSVPQVPSPTTTATQALQGNISNLGDLYGLSAGVGAASGAGAMAQYSGSIPGLPGYLGQAGGAVSSELAGQLPADVMAQLQLGGAQRGIGTGTQGSANSNAAYMQMLGLSSLGMQQQGQKDLAQLIGMTPAGPAFNPASMLVNPSDQQSAAGYNSVMSAAPNPTMAAQASLNAARAGMGMGGTGIGAPSSPSGAVAAPAYQNPTWQYGSGTSTAPYQAPVNPATGFYNLPTGNNTGWNGGGDAYGNGFQQTSGGSLYTGDLSGYNDAIDSSIFGWGLGEGESGPEQPQFQGSLDWLGLDTGGM